MATAAPDDQVELPVPDQPSPFPTRKGWTLPTLERLGVTFEAGRFVFQLQTDAGEPCGTVRYSDNGATPKMLAGRGDDRELWPRPEVIEGPTLFVVEGEPDALSMAELGFPAVAYPGVGASKRLSAEWPHRWVFGPDGRRERVVFVPDCDDGGRAKSREFAAKVAAVGVPAFVADLDPDRHDGYDVGDLLMDLGADMARAYVARVVEKAERVGPGAEPDDDLSHVPPAYRERDGGTPTREVVLTPASAIRSERIRWLERGRIPLRGLTVVAGEKGLGKSILTNAKIVAAVTWGLLDGELEGTPADVLIVTAEDDWRSVVKPRLMAHGADLDRVHRVEVKDEDGVSLLTLPNDVKRLEAAIIGLREAGHVVALVVVDPVGAFVPEAANTHADAPVRRMLAPLAAMADGQDLAVVAVMHLTKNEATRLINRVSGSGAFVNAARSVLGVVRDPEDPDGEQGVRRLILHVASNWGRYAPTLAAHVEGRLVDTDDGERSDVGFLVIDGETSVSVDDVQRGPDDDGDDAEEAIAAALAKGPRPSRDVKTTVAGELGCSRKTVERAAMRMRDRAELAVEKSGFPGPTTTWTLLGTPPLGTKADTRERPLWGNPDLERDSDGSNAHKGHAPSPGPHVPDGGWKPYVVPGAPADDEDRDDWRQR